MKNNELAKTPQGSFPSQEIQLASQLVDQYRKAIAGTREVLIFGAMMFQLGATLELQICHGGSHEGKTLKGWIEEFCPSINYNTAYSFYSMARGLREALSIPIDTDIHHLLTAPVDSLSKKEAKIRDLIDGAIDGKSARQLEFDFGIRRARAALPSAGGAREGAGRPPRSLTKEQIEIDAFFSKEALGSFSVAVLEKRWHLRLDPEKKSVLLAIADRLVADLKERT